MDKSSGYYILFCDSDDYVADTWCETLISGIENDKCVLSVCGVEVKNDAGKSYYRNNSEMNAYSVTDFFKLDRDNVITYTVWDKAFIKTLIPCGFDTTIDFGEDALFVLNYIRAQDANSMLSVGSSPQYVYRVSNSERLSNKWRDSYTNFCEKRIEIVKDMGSKWNTAPDIVKQYIDRKEYSRIMAEINNTITKRCPLKNNEKLKRLNKLFCEMKPYKSLNKGKTRFEKLIRFSNPLVLLIYSIIIAKK